MYSIKIIKITAIVKKYIGLYNDINAIEIHWFSLKINQIQLLKIQQ